MKNPKTTFAGIGVLLTALYPIAVNVANSLPTHQQDILRAVIAFFVSVGLVAAKDGGK